MIQMSKNTLRPQKTQDWPRLIKMYPKNSVKSNLQVAKDIINILWVKHSFDSYLLQQVATRHILLLISGSDEGTRYMRLSVVYTKKNSICLWPAQETFKKLKNLQARIEVVALFRRPFHSKCLITRCFRHAPLPTDWDVYTTQHLTCHLLHVIRYYCHDQKKLLLVEACIS